MTSTRQRPLCTALRRDGQPCRARASLNGLCIGHQPAAAEARRKGGFRSSKAHRLQRMLPARLRPVAAVLERAIMQTHRGDLDPRAATALASLASALVRVLESGEIEDRLRRLEAELHPETGGEHGA